MPTLDDFNGLLLFVAPGSVVEAPRLDTNLSLEEALAAALDDVVWASGYTPPTVATVVAAIPAFLADRDARLLAETKVAALGRIDAEAEAQRRRYITPGEGQAMVYLQKQAEARAFVADPNPSPVADYPLLYARANATGVTPAEVAAEWNARAGAWTAIAAAIETAREGAKSAVEAAATATEISAIMAVLAWPQAPA